MLAAKLRADEPPRPYGVVDDPYFEPRAGFADQDFGDGAADAVVADDVILHVDRTDGVLQGCDQRRESVVAVVQQFDAVAGRGARSAAAGDDLFHGVAPVVARLGRRGCTAVSGQHVKQRAGDGQQEDKCQPYGG